MLSPNFEKLPNQLIALHRWVVWRLEARDGKVTKVLYQARQVTQKAAVNDSSTWATFDAAQSAYEVGGVSGVGFVLANDDPYVCIDLDNVWNERGDLLRPDWLEMAKRFGSYTERSQSGCGLHVFIRGKKPDARSIINGIEIYAERRYIAITGHREPWSPIEILDGQGVLDTIYRTATKPESFRPAPTAASEFTLDDEAILDCARRAANGWKFFRLWDGDTSGYGDDHSSADAALCSLLAFYTQDATQLDRLFRGSALMRQKWDERHRADGATYGEMTIEQAVRNVTATYSGMRNLSAGSATTSNGINESQGQRTAIADEVRIAEPLFPVRAFPDVVRRYIIESARAIGVPPEMVGTPALAAIGALIGPAARIEIKPNWQEPTNIWAAVVGYPGSGKTPAILAALSGVNALQDAAYERHKTDRAQFEIELKRMKDAQSIAGASDEQPVEPKLTHFFVSDVTREALLPMLEHSNGIVVYADELSTWLANFDAYRNGKGGDRSAFLSLWSGTPTKVDRKIGNQHLYIKHPSLSIVGGIQPDLLTVFKNDRGDDGFLDRILFVCTDAPAPSWTDDCVSDELKSAYILFCERLSRLRDVEDPAEVRISSQARARYVGWYDDNVLRINTNRGASGFYSKMPGHIARIALILHCTKHENPGKYQVSEQTMSDAIELGEFYAHHTRLIREKLGLSVPERDTGIEGRVIRVLSRRYGAGVEWVGHSDLLNALRSVKAPQLDDVVGRLTEAGRIEQRTRNSGTKPATEYRLIQMTARSDYSEFSDYQPEKPLNTVGMERKSEFSEFSEPIVLRNVIPTDCGKPHLCEDLGACPNYQIAGICPLASPIIHSPGS